jgi:hypothetical protein
MIRSYWGLEPVHDRAVRNLVLQNLKDTVSVLVKGSVPKGIGTPVTAVKVQK